MSLELQRLKERDNFQDKSHSSIDIWLDDKDNYRIFLNQDFLEFLEQVEKGS